MSAPLLGGDVILTARRGLMLDGAVSFEVEPLSVALTPLFLRVDPVPRDWLASRLRALGSVDLLGEERGLTACLPLVACRQGAGTTLTLVLRPAPWQVDAAVLPDLQVTVECASDARMEARRVEAREVHEARCLEVVAALREAQDGASAYHALDDLVRLLGLRR